MPVNLTMHPDVVKLLDGLSEAAYTSRSRYIEKLVREDWERQEKRAV